MAEEIEIVRELDDDCRDPEDVVDEEDADE